jgi:predicted metal-dependent phosphoesterase TrpH
LGVRKDASNSIVSISEANNLLQQGYFGIDPHCHSSFSFDVPDVQETSPENIISKQISMGLRPILSDHDTLNGYNYLRKKGMTGSMRHSKGVIPASEITIKPLKPKLVDTYGPIHTLHINVFGLNNSQLEIIEEIAQKHRDLDAMIAYLKREGLKWQYNHPFWHEVGEKLNWRAIPGLAKYYFDVIELNMSRPKSFNDLALRMAMHLNKGIISSTDCHIGQPGRVFTIAEGKNFDEFWQNVIDGKSKVVRKDITTWGVVKESSEMISNIFRANINTHKDRQLSKPTGIAPIDKLATAVTSGSIKNMYYTKKVIHSMLYTLNYTAGPFIAWKLYTSKENNLAEKIKLGVERMVRKLKNVEDSIKTRQLHKRYIARQKRQGGYASNTN